MRGVVALLAVLVLAGCSPGSRVVAPAYVGHWTNSDLREGVHFTDAGQFLLERDASKALGTYTPPDGGRTVRAEATWEVSRASKSFTLDVTGDALALGLGGATYRFGREAPRPPSDPAVVGLWQFRDFEWREFTSYGCVITSFKGGGVKVGDYTVQGGRLGIRDRGDPEDFLERDYRVTGDQLQWGDSAFRRVAARR